MSNPTTPIDMRVRKEDAMSKGQDGKGTSEELRRRAFEGFFLHFFTNLNLAADANEALEPYKLTRLHHRILTLVSMMPGVTVGELVRALKVSHQNVNGPMRQLIQQGLVTAETGTEDRRQKHLFASAEGHEIVQAVLGRQLARLENAFRHCGPEAVQAFLEIHRHLVEEEDRAWIDRLSLDPHGLSHG